jgi:glycosyltransferase involved in cell wall biosynthesis
LAALLDRAVSAAVEAGFDADRFQLVLVDNGSTDATAAKLNELKNSLHGKWFSVVHVQVNQGYGYGLMAGLSSTTAPYVGWSHADQQCDPRDAFHALATLKSNASPNALVKGVRSGRNKRDIFVSRVFEFCARIFLGFHVYEINAQPKVFGRALLRELVNPPNTFAFDLYVLYHAAKAGYQVLTIPVVFPPRVHGVSKWASTLLGRYKTIGGMLIYMRQLASAEGRL